jgi:hypothetical protein
MADYNLKVITADTDGPSADTELLFGSPDQSSGTPKPYSFGGIRNYVKAQNGIFPFSDPDFIDSSIYLTTPIIAAGGAGVMVANQLSMIPIWVPRTRTYTTYALIVTILAGTSGVRLGLYNANSSLQPTTKIDEATAVIDTSTGTGVIGLKTVAFGTSQSLSPGMYFLASLSDGAPTVYRMSNSTSPALGIRFAASTTSFNGGKFRAGVTYTTLPADETAQTYTSQASAGSGLPLAGIR